ncbi:GntR family transcriptional regulator [Prauserella flavalba]|uniref:GntR family transcriptional regulator n=1 Tax=Prauserella flavalba TaxID=1477506 RepID=UPI0036E24C4A
MSRGTPLGEQVYVRLREEVLGGDAGRLSEARLAKRLGVSRTPVREALTRLVADGLVRRDEYGYSLVVPSLATVRELHEVTVAVELRGLERCLEEPSLRHDPAVLTAELERWYALRAGPTPTPAEFVVHDDRFHATLLGSAGNAELVATLVTVQGRARHARLHYGLLDHRVEHAVTEHIEIAELVLAGELRAASTLLRRHLGPAPAVRIP